MLPHLFRKVLIYISIEIKLMYTLVYLSFMKETWFSTMTNVLSSEIPCNLTWHF
jgi:hypothetical protein